MAGQKIKSDPPFNAMSRHASTLVDLLNEASKRVPLQHLLWKLVPNTSPPEYRYEFTTTDGRLWKQVIVFDGQDVDPPMDFTTGRFRQRSEFSHFRALRDHLVVMRNAYDLSLLDVDWT